MSEYEKLTDNVAKKIKKDIINYIDISIKDAIKLGLKGPDLRDFCLGRFENLASRIKLDLVFNCAIDNRWGDEEEK